MTSHTKTLFRRLGIYTFRGFAIFGFAITIGVLVISLNTSQSISNTSTDEDIYLQLTLFGNAFELIRDQYVEDVDDEALIETAINGMLSNLDPHSNYLTEEAFKKNQQHTKGEFGGLGIEVTMEDGYVKVVSPIDNTPAAKAGLQAGDLIITIDDQDVLGLSLSDAVETMRGPAGTDIHLTVLRGNDNLFDVTLTRDIIKTRAVRHESYGDVGYIRIINFTEQTTSDLKKTVTELKKSHDTALKGIVLDLRNNPGGLLNESISVSDAFLDEGEIVSTRGRHDQNNSRHYAEPGDILGGLPIVVLINSGSASASEIVAGALKDHKRAIIMGTRSFGKGSVQSIVPIRGHGAIRLTTARYYTPSGSSIQSTGIEPDIIVDRAVLEDAEETTFREENLRGALDNQTTNGDNSAEGDDADKKNEELEDYQLARALDLLEGLSVFEYLQN
jgi:carboxyl-terminal processing protease